MKMMSGAALSVAWLAFASVAHIPAASAADRLIWQPTRMGDNGLHLRMGVKLPAIGEASAGADLAVAATRSGRVEDAPVDVWVRAASRSGVRTAVVTSRSIDGSFDPRSGSGHVDVSTTRTRILSEAFDLERIRGVNLFCSDHLKRCDAVTVHQAARLTSLATGTAIVAEGQYASDTRGITHLVRVEQQITRKMNMTAVLAAPFETKRQASIGLSYAFTW
ncbi:hypothetical protein [Rhizobium sp. Leaf341]|uniref:hypothetical protein n=1 Tax=Rhizobium sp. Leaf341 TaxID=1736344 RepID=UPI0007136A03|nr:hypothetical protein [Rhizobium sp. Leaf341]KQR73917.1 hypothetical protein ASG03_20850 [Rhizobium sp. Leaf341]